MKTTRTHTRAIVVVHSHVVEEPYNGVIDLSGDVTSVAFSKSVKGAGNATVTVVPRKNYFNVIYPNDVVNIYFDVNDGNGFIRTFFGYIDRVGRKKQTGDDGQVHSEFRINCTDMSKAFDRTDIYFNPQFESRAGKGVLDERFTTESQLGGSALRTRGLRAQGSPAELIENMVSLLLGYGAQWTLPDSYANRAKPQIAVNKRIRQDRAKRRVSQKAIGALYELIPSAAGKPLERVLSEDIDAVKKALNEGIVTLENLGFSKSQAVKDFKKKKDAINKLLEGGADLQSYRTILLEVNDTSGSIPTTILDLIDLRFIESLAIDGQITSAPVWQKQGTLASMMYSFSNEIVNELILDLRPVVEEREFGSSVFGHEYSRESDELGINTDGFGNMQPSSPGIKYVPAIVFREYPFSTAAGLDLSAVWADKGVRDFGTIPFGPVFAIPANQDKPSRVVYSYSTMPGWGKRRGLRPPKTKNEPTNNTEKYPHKHLDVFPIKTTDIISEDVGRSDHEVFNLLSVYATDPAQSIYKFILKDFSPILTPVSILRHGLRVKEETTRFANHSGLETENSSEGSGVDNQVIRRNLLRLALLMDHWNQHNVEYLSGNFTLKPSPMLRPGYRLDISDRHESYYVEQVSHNWRYPGAMTTQIQVTRGQRNDPHPAYIPPQVKPFEYVLPSTGFVVSGSFSKEGGGNRTKNGRLALYFDIKSGPGHTGAIGGDELTLDYGESNDLDTKPNADFGRRAEYSYAIQKIMNLDNETKAAVEESKLNNKLRQVSRTLKSISDESEED